ncbi:MAG TPA: LamG-like jellyroll fold domain-containing protein [Sedimentisphaerales bacterium]|nr:LamG-like jellyroll fold domain-containing protein [Sedimentisphaerales bacterium]
MKNQATIRYLLSITVSLLVLCANAEAGLYFFDDFSDGDPADGSPVNWLSAGDEHHTGYTLTPEGLQVGSATAADRDGTPYIYRDVSVRVQIKRTSNHTNGEWESGLVCRWNDGGPGGYWIEVRPPNRFWLGHRDRGRLKSAVLPFNVDERELIIRVDAIGDQFKCWCWPADEPMPDEPQITLVEDVVPDGTFALYAGTQGGQAIYRWAEAVSVEAPSVDLNGDGKVDISDLLRLIESWWQDDPMCDIAPPPFCDGIVDVLDLELLMSHWGQPVDDPTLVAHWALDETEGSNAHDSISGNDDLVMGSALWQPAGGMVDGALELDGVDDCLITAFGPNPADGPFSVIAWVRGGAAGQAAISEPGGANWLCTDPSTGELITEIEGSGGSGGPLLSQAGVTDGEWHRIGLVWDGLHRTLYVDDAVVAEDVQDGLEGSGNGLYIGTGKAMEPGSFWSGLIDDIRIYNRAVKP